MSSVTEIPVEKIDLGDMELWPTGFRTRSSSGCARRRPCTGARWRRGRTSRASGRSRAPRTSTRSAATGRRSPPARWCPRHRSRHADRAPDANVHRDGPAPARQLKALFQRGFTPKRIAEHEEAIRAIVTRVLDRVDDREEIELVYEIAAPVVGRVIGSFVGTAEEDDYGWSRQFAIRAMAFGDDELPSPTGWRQSSSRSKNLRRRGQARRRAPSGPHR